MVKFHCISIFRGKENYETQILRKFLCVLLACLMVIPFCTEFAKLPQIWAASSDIVDIPDVNMKAALNSALNVEDSSADITKEQLESPLL